MFGVGRSDGIDRDERDAEARKIEIEADRACGNVDHVSGLDHDRLHPVLELLDLGRARSGRLPLRRPDGVGIPVRLVGERPRQGDARAEFGRHLDVEMNR